MGKRLDHLRRALQEAPDDPKLLLDFAHQALLAQEAEDAEGSFRHLLKIQPHSIEARLGLAECLQNLGKSSEAAVRLENLLHEQPGLSRAHLLLARIALSEQDRYEAQHQWRRAQHADPSLVDEELEKEFGNSVARGVGRITHDGIDWNGRGDESDDEEDDNFDEGFQIEDFGPPQVTLSDVSGLEPIAEQLTAQLGTPAPELLALLNHRPRGGALLYGPPGCGKSLLAEAVAGSAGVPFLAIGLHQLLDSYVGNAEKNLHDLFQLASSRGPAVLFLDELDAFGAERGQQRFTPTRTLLSQLLVELDRLAPESGTLVIGATSAPWELDGSLLRAGRLGSSLFVAPPTLQARRELLRDSLETAIPSLIAGSDEQRDATLNAVVEATEGFSAADLRHLVLNWLTDGIASGIQATPRPEALLSATLQHHSEVTSWRDEARESLADNSAASRRFPELIHWLEQNG